MRIPDPPTLALAAAALVGARNIHILAVLGHGATGELNALGLEHGGKLVVGQRMTGILFLDELAHLALEHQKRRVGALRPVRPFGEKEAQLDFQAGELRILKHFPGRCTENR